MTIVRALVCTGVILSSLAGGARAEQSAGARDEAVVQPAGRPAAGQRLAPPVLLSVEVLPDAAPAADAASCEDDHGGCDSARAAVPDGARP
jgi:hypothetical protein